MSAIIKGIILSIGILSISACTTTETPIYKIGFSQCTAGDAWRLAMHEEMKRELSFHPKISLEIKDAQNSNELQIQQINEFLASDIDLLIVSPNEAEPITPIIEKAYQQGIPVIIVDRKTTSDQYTAYVGADNHEIGVTAGRYAATLLKNGGNILEITGLPGSSPAQGRHQGFLEGISNNSKIKIVGSINGQWEQNIAQEEVGKVANQYKYIDLVYAHNDVMAKGVYDEFKKIGLANKMMFLGVDGLASDGAGLDLVDNGILYATFLYPTGGEEAIRIAADILEQRAFAKDNKLTTTIIDGSNVRLMKLQADKIQSQQYNIERQQQRLEQQLQVSQNRQTQIYLLIGVLILTILLGANSVINLREKKEANKILERKNEEILAQQQKIIEVSEQAKKATEAKFEFFTNISHEFRTPLTLILGPTEEMLNHKTVKRNYDLKKDLGLVRKNAIRLLRLVTQLMDFRKIENGKMKIKASENDLVLFIGNIKSAFDKNANRRNIEYHFITKESTLLVWYDQNMLDKVLFNLLSNAFKFTKDYGRIHVYLEKDIHENVAIITIDDNGRGMSKEHAKHAFERFYQGEQYNSKGTGLGLSLSKELINLHHGEIYLQSEKFKGTRFTITLPLGKDHLNLEEIVEKKQKEITYEDYKIYIEEDEESLAGIDAKVSEHEATILLIEDNPDLQLFLKSKLKKWFDIKQAYDGKHGVQMAFETVPDLIICDIMLPGQSGLAVTKTLKADLRTSHIPVIMLTARDTMQQQIDGLKSGADVYITKPFNFEYLKQQINTLLKNRDHQRERYLNELPSETEQPTVNQLDKQFVNQFIAVVEANISNQNFNVNQLTHDLGMSRIQVYRKAKALLGYSINDYIKTVRLKKAKQLLLKPELSISDVAYEVGFASPAYFSTAFKAKFDVTPSEFRTGRS